MIQITNKPQSFIEQSYPKEYQCPNCSNISYSRDGLKCESCGSWLLCGSEPSVVTNKKTYYYYKGEWKLIPNKIQNEEQQDVYEPKRGESETIKMLITRATKFLGFEYKG